MEQAVETLCQTGPALLTMVHTHDGAAAACMVVAYGSARDRKRIVKAVKGHVVRMATNEWAHAPLCAALAVVDDTALLAKCVVPELKARASLPRARGSFRWPPRCCRCSWAAGGRAGRERLRSRVASRLHWRGSEEGERDENQ